MNLMASVCRWKSVVFENFHDIIYIWKFIFAIFIFESYYIRWVVFTHFSPMEGHYDYIQYLLEFFIAFPKSKFIQLFFI